METHGPERRFALVVAGPQHPVEQLAELAKLARHQLDAQRFFELVRTPRKVRASVRGRLDQIEGLVKKALIDTGAPDPDDGLIQQRSWELLERLEVVMPRLESPNESDWATILNELIPYSRGRDLAGVLSLRNMLVALASEYVPTAATVDLSALRRAAHATLESSIRSQQQGWQALNHLNQRAVSSVRDSFAARMAITRSRSGSLSS